MHWMRSGRQAARLGLAAAVALLGCGDATGPAAADVEGMYILERVDGRAVEDGESTLSFSARAGETAPLYGWNVREAPTHTFDSDVGIWSMDGRRVRFRSQRGLGTYAATPEPVTDGATGGPRLMVRGHGGQAYTFRRVRGPGPPAASGSLEIAVVDAAGRQVGGATLRIRAPDGLVTRAGSTEYHTFLTGGPAGEWTITVTPPTGRALAPDQPNPIRVVVPARQTVVVRIALVPTGGG